MNEGENKTILYYVHDPMCSWCWGFQRVWQQLQAKLPDYIERRLVLGGLAADSAEPMPMALQQSLQAIWRRIEQQIPHVQFNFDFWTQCQPRRSTYPACRAVIAARLQSPSYEAAMILAIQITYYQQAQNPSDDEVLVALAEQIGLDKNQFFQQLNDPDVQQQLVGEISLAKALGAQGFPSLLLLHNGEITRLNLDYNDAKVMIDQVNELVVCS